MTFFIAAEGITVRGERPPSRREPPVNYDEADGSLYKPSHETYGRPITMTAKTAKLTKEVSSVNPS
jgi:hypothetical protein